MYISEEKTQGGFPALRRLALRDSGCVHPVGLGNLEKGLAEYQAKAMVMEPWESSFAVGLVWGWFMA